MKGLNKKGLTLIELMAVISVLAVVALIVAPNIVGSLRKYRNKMYETQLDNIISAAKNWAADEISRKHCLICIPENGSVVTMSYCLKNGGEGCVEASIGGEEVLSVYLGELEENGYIKEDLQNPKTDEPFNRCVKVDITRDKTTGEFLYNIPNADTLEECKNYDSSISAMVVYEIKPSGWAQSKTVTITYPENYSIKEYSIDDGTTWKEYEAPITLNENKKIFTRVGNSEDDLLIQSESITQIDATAPTVATFTYTKTTDSITVIANGTDNESGIVRYAFSKDGGTTWTSTQASKVYTFTGLSIGTYDIRVRVWNGTYVNGITGNYKDSDVQSVNTAFTDPPTYDVSPSGWAQSKTVTITYPSGYTNEYSLDGGKTWQEYTEALTFKASGTVIARVTDGSNIVMGTTQTVTQVDATAPTAASFTYTNTSDSITVKASGTDHQSGIVMYSFAKATVTTNSDGSDVTGSYVWTTPQASNEYTFTGLTTGTYRIKVRVWNGTYVNGTTGNYKDSSSTDISI